MPESTNHFYNPFAGSFLGAVLPNTSLIPSNGQIILEDIDLYYQPVPHPLASGIHAAFSAIVLFLGLYLHIKIMICLKKDDSILKGITKVFVVTNLT